MGSGASSLGPSAEQEDLDEPQVHTGLARASAGALPCAHARMPAARPVMLRSAGPVPRQRGRHRTEDLCVAARGP
jgi:hypothetical protein